MQSQWVPYVDEPEIRESLSEADIPGAAFAASFELNIAYGMQAFICVRCKMRVRCL